MGREGVEFCRSREAGDLEVLFELRWPMSEGIMGRGITMGDDEWAVGASEEQVGE